MQKYLNLDLFKIPLVQSIGIVLGISIFILPDLWTSYKLARFGVAANGLVLQANCLGKRPVVEFEFSAEDRWVVGKGSTGYGNPACRSLRRGDKVTLSYIPQDPTTNMLGHPEENLRRMVVFWIPMLFVAGLSVYFSSKWKHLWNQ
jgi:hypothetical protein